MSIFDELTTARQQGANRIYGYPVHRSADTNSYMLKAVGRPRRVYFARELPEATYLAAVKHWIQLKESTSAEPLPEVSTYAATAEA